MNRPDHRTINRFRGVEEQLLDIGLIDLEKYFVDGMKVRSECTRAAGNRGLTIVVALQEMKKKAQDRHIS